MASRIAPSTSPDGEFVAALDVLVEAFQHAARLLDGVARAFERDVIAALLGDDAEPALDQRQVLAVLAEQHRGVGGCRRRRARSASAARVRGAAPVLGRVRAVRNGSSGSPRPPRAAAARLARMSASVAEQAVGADFGDGHRRDLADQAMPAPMTCTGCRYGERPTIWPGWRPGFSNSTSKVRPTQRAMNAACCRVDRRPAGAAAARPSPASGNLLHVGGRRAGPRRIFERIGAGEADLVDQRAACRGNRPRSRRGSRR